MIKVGKRQKLVINNFSSVGAYLFAGTDDDKDNILLPNNELEGKDLKEGDEVEVLIYRDSEDRLIATFRKTEALVGTLAKLEVVDTKVVGNRVGHNALAKFIADSHWSEDNRDAYAVWPRLSPTSIENNSKTSTWFMRDGSFLRLKQLEIGYTIPEKVTNKVGIKNLRFYVTGNNLLCFSKFKLWDPEMAGAGLGYPVQRVYNVGLNLTF